MNREKAPSEPLSEQARLRWELAKERHATAGLKARLSEIEASSSWRVTAPLRWLVSWFRGDARDGRVEPANPTVRVPVGVPDELLRRALPPANSDLSCRLVDARDLLVDLLPEEVMVSFSGKEEQTGIWQFGTAVRGCVALVGGNDIARELAFESRVLQLTPERWAEQLDGECADFLLIDVDFHGLPADWARSLRRSEGPVADLLQHCKERRIKVVFWLKMEKEDYHQVARWLPFASAVYNVDEALETIVEADLGEVRVGLLPPAVQPRLYNPVRTPLMCAIRAGLTETVLFDGLVAALESNKGKWQEPASDVLLVESYWDVGCAKASTLSESGAAVLGVVDTVDKLALLRMVGAEFFDATHGRPRWRVETEMLRAAASGALVGMGPECGIRWPFDASCQPAAASPAGLKSLLADPITAAAWRQGAIRKVLAGHTIAHRLQTIRMDLGLEPDAADAPLVSCLLVSKRPERIRAFVDAFNHQSYPAKELIVVIHGDDGSWDEPLADSSGSRVVVLNASFSLGLGDCLNMAFAEARGQFWAKFDDDDYYGPEYLGDLMRVMQNTDCDIAGKPLVFTAFEIDDSLFWDPSRHDLTHTLHARGWPRGVVCGATLAGRREVLEQIRFSNHRRYGADSVFLDDCARHGFRLVVGDAFGFACRRSAEAGFHTWEGEENGVRARGRRVGDGSAVKDVVDA